MLSHNVANGPESKTTRVFRAVRRVVAQGAKSAVSDCILLSVELSNAVDSSNFNGLNFECF